MRCRLCECHRAQRTERLERARASREGFLPRMQLELGLERWMVLLSLASSYRSTVCQALHLALRYPQEREEMDISPGGMSKGVGMGMLGHLED